MDAVFNVIDLSALQSDAISFVLAVLVIGLMVTAVFYVTRLIFPQVGTNSDD